MCCYSYSQSNSFFSLSLSFPLPRGIVVVGRLLLCSSTLFLDRLCCELLLVRNTDWLLSERSGALCSAGDAEFVLDSDFRLDPAVPLPLSSLPGARSDRFPVRTFPALEEDWSMLKSLEVRTELVRTTVWQGEQGEEE